MKLGIACIALALASGCAGGLDASCELHVGATEPNALPDEPQQWQSTDDMVVHCDQTDRSCWEFIPGTSMPESYSAPAQSFAGVLSPNRR